MLMKVSTGKMGGVCVRAQLQTGGAASQVLMLNALHFSVSGDPDAAPVQLHGCGTGTEREDSGSGHLLPRSRRQQHAAQLHRERCHHPAGPRGPRRLALRREREDQDVSPASGSSSQIWLLGRPPSAKCPKIPICNILTPPGAAGFPSPTPG